MISSERPIPVSENSPRPALSSLQRQPIGGDSRFAISAYAPSVNELFLDHLYQPSSPSSLVARFDPIRFQHSI